MDTLQRQDIDQQPYQKQKDHRQHQQQHQLQGTNERGPSGRRVSGLALYQKTFGIGTGDESDVINVTGVAKNSSITRTNFNVPLSSSSSSSKGLPPDDITQKFLSSATKVIGDSSYTGEPETSKSDSHNQASNNKNDGGDDDGDDGDLSESDLNAIYAAAAKVGGGDDVSSGGTHDSAGNKRRPTLRESFTQLLTADLNVQSMLHSYVSKNRRSFADAARRSFTDFTSSLTLLGGSAANAGNTNIENKTKNNNNNNNSNSGTAGKETNAFSSSPTGRTRRRSFTRLRRSFTELMGLTTSIPESNVDAQASATTITDKTKSQQQSTGRKRSWWSMTPLEIVRGCVGYSSNSDVNPSLDPSSSTALLSADDGSESLLHQSCRLYSKTTDVVGSALNVDPSGVRRRWVSSRGLKKRRIDCYSLPINIALENNASLDVIRLLANAGPDVLIEPDGPEGCSSLSVALTHVKDKSILREITDIILTKNPDCISHADKRSNYPLHVACNRGGECDAEMVQTLTKKFPLALTKRNFYGHTPLDLAQRVGNLVKDDSVVDYLQQMSYDILEAGADHITEDSSD